MSLELVGRNQLDRRPSEQCDATWWRQATEGSAYVRCLLPARHLPGQVLSLLPSDLRPRHPLLPEPWMPRHRGAGVFPFTGDRVRALLMAHLQEQGHRVVLEVDDNYLVSAPKVGGYKGEWGSRIGDARATNEAHGRIVPWCDAVICATPRLAKTYSRLNGRVFVCQNTVDPDDWPRLPYPGGKFRIMYAGAPGHRNDSPIVARAVEWAAKQPDVEVVAFGFRPAGWENIPHRVIPWTDDLWRYRFLLGDADVGLCPLVENQWSIGKSDLKVLEYAMGGALPIVQRAEPYRPWWEKETPVLVAERAKDFFHHVKWCVNNRDEARRLALEVRAQVLAERTIQSNVWRWREAIAGE